jgi:hypothetical protein
MLCPLVMNGISFRPEGRALHAGKRIRRGAHQLRIRATLRRRRTRRSRRTCSTGQHLKRLTAGTSSLERSRRSSVSPPPQVHLRLGRGVATVRARERRPGCHA